MEEQLKEKQGGELEGMQLFLDYTNDKSSHVNMAKKGLRGFSKCSYRYLFSCILRKSDCRVVTR